MKKQTVLRLSKLALLMATVIWGSTFFIMEGTIEYIGIFSLLASRFTIAAVILAAVLHKSLKKLDRGYIVRGCVMGVLVLSAYIAQTYGLADPGTTAGKNAFLTAIYCILVPFMFWAVKGVRPDRYNILAAIMCILGITLVSMTGNDFSGGICRGDLLTLLGGVFYAMHMTAVSIFSKDRDILLLTMLQFLSAGLIAWIPAAALDTFPSSFSYTTALAILYLAVMATCVCYVLQNVGQKFTPPATAALILSLEAVFGVIFSVIFTSETVTLRLFIGFAVIFAAVLVSEVKPAFLGGRKE